MTGEPIAAPVSRRRFLHTLSSRASVRPRDAPVPWPSSARPRSSAPASEATCGSPAD